MYVPDEAESLFSVASDLLYNFYVLIFSKNSNTLNLGGGATLVRIKFKGGRDCPGLSLATCLFGGVIV